MGDLKIQLKLIIFTTCFIFLTYTWLPENKLDTAYADEGNGSTIAGVNVSGLDREEMEGALQQAIGNWNTEPIIVTGGGTKLEIDPSELQFDIETTLSEYETLVDKPWYAFWKSEKIVHIPLKINAEEQLKNKVAAVLIWDTDKTYNNVLGQATYLKEHQVEAKVKDLSIFENERLALSIEEIPENAHGIGEVIDLLNNKIVNPGEQFSLIETIGEIPTTADDEALNFIASMLYSTVLQTEYDVVERYPQEEVPSYLEPGKEASFNINFNEDLKFLNNSEHVAKIKATTEENSLKLEIYSDSKGKEVTVRVEKDSISPRIIYRYSNKLASGQQKLIQEGSEGMRVSVYRTISDNGSFSEEEVSRNYYAPVNRIVLKSSRQSVVSNGTGNATNEIPQTSETTDPNLQVDLDGDGLPDYEMEKPKNEEDLPPGSYYDKGGNLVTP